MKVSGLEFEPEPEYFVRAICIDCAATAATTIRKFLLRNNYTNVSPTPQTNLGGIAAIDFSLFPYRSPKSMWPALDQTFNPEGPRLHLVRGRSA